jgi:hypothetical protein
MTTTFVNAAARDSNIPHPTIGQDVFLVDTGSHLFYYGANLGWQQAWNTAWGERAYAEITANTATLTPYGSKDTIPGLSFNVVPLINRQYQFEFDGLVSSSVNGDLISVTVHTINDVIITPGVHPSDSIGEETFKVSMSPSAGDPARFAWRFTYNGTPRSAPVPFALSATQLFGTGACVLVANHNGITRIRVVDLGPTGNPVY